MHLSEIFQSSKFLDLLIFSLSGKKRVLLKPLPTVPPPTDSSAHRPLATSQI